MSYRKAICHCCFRWDLIEVDAPPEPGSPVNQPCPHCDDEQLYWDGPMPQDIFDAFKAQYLKELGEWDWAAIRAEAEREPVREEGPSSGLVGRTYLGSLCSLSPSGKIYTPFANSNVAEYEAARDQAWQEALEETADQHTMWIESGEGSADDLFAGCLVEEDKQDE